MRPGSKWCARARFASKRPRRGTAAMSTGLLVLMGALAVSLGGAAPAAAAAHRGGPGPTPYYLALGDSLAQGVQPNAQGTSVETKQGYADDLYAVYRSFVPGLQFEDLGCPGETAHSMIVGGVCTYGSQPSQLAAAVAFLATHHVVLITIDIGANTVDGCVVDGELNPTCVGAGFVSTESYLPSILGALQEAAPNVPVVGMNYYDPFLADWLAGATGQAVAKESVTVATEFDTVLGDAYGAFGDPVADVEGAFETTDMTLIPFVNKPVDVSLICAWTWMCAAAPRGPNIHANAIGYAVIAGAFTRVIDPRHL